jgi:hypothetical protein
MGRETYEEEKKTLEGIQRLVREGNLTEEEGQILEPAKQQLAGYLCSPWFPFGRIRRSGMILLAAVGGYGLMKENYYLLLAWVPIPFFSPRLAGELVMALGKIFRGSA